MAHQDDPGEYIPPRRIEEGDIVLFYDTSISEDKERGVVASVDADAENQPASIRIYSDDRIETDVPFAQGDYQPDRGYIFNDLIEGPGEL